MFPETHQNRTLSVGYSLGMVKMEAFDNSHFMHQAVRGGHTDHTGSIISPMACIFDSNLGMEAFDDSLHQAVRGGFLPWHAW